MQNLSVRSNQGELDDVHANALPRWTPRGLHRHRERDALRNALVARDEEIARLQTELLTQSERFTAAFAAIFGERQLEPMDNIGE